MRPNHLRELWAADRPALNGWVSIPDAYLAELVAHQGWDSVTVDQQHGPGGEGDLAGLLAAISASPAMPMVRVQNLDRGRLMKALDCGAYGVICPMIDSRHDAEELVAATTYPPRGARSFGPMRGLLYGGPDYYDRADKTILRFAMIETAGALNSLEDIASVQGLDGLYVGPSDLSCALGYPPMADPEAPVVLDAIKRICQAARNRGMVAAVHTGSPEFAVRMVELGARLVTVGTDARILAAATREFVTRSRTLLEGCRP